MINWIKLKEHHEMKKITLSLPKYKPRNMHAFSPIMKKGGVHVKTNKAQRRIDKIELSKHSEH